MSLVVFRLNTKNNQQKLTVFFVERRKHDQYATIRCRGGWVEPDSQRRGSILLNFLLARFGFTPIHRDGQKDGQEPKELSRISSIVLRDER